MYSSSTALYLPMGWVVVVVAPAPLVARMPSSFLVLLISGSLRYSLGASVFLFDNCVHCAHFVRHLFVLSCWGQYAPLLCGAVVRVRETPVPLLLRHRGWVFRPGPLACNDCSRTGPQTDLNGSRHMHPPRCQ